MKIFLRKGIGQRSLLCGMEKTPIPGPQRQKRRDHEMPFNCLKPGPPLVVLRISQGLQASAPFIIGKQVEDVIPSAAPGNPAVAQLAGEHDTQVAAPCLFEYRNYPAHVGGPVLGGPGYFQAELNGGKLGYFIRPDRDMLDVLVKLRDLAGKRPFIGQGSPGIFFQPGAAGRM